MRVIIFICGFARLIQMTLDSVNIKELIQKALLSLEQEAHISSSFKALITVLLNLMQLLLEELQLNRQRRFGKKTEVDTSEPIEPKPDNPLIPVAAHTRATKTRGRKIDTQALPRFKVYHDLEAGKQQCPCCAQALDTMGFDSAEQLEIIPKRLYVIEHIRYKYSCRKCQKSLRHPNLKRLCLRL